MPLNPERERQRRYEKSNREKERERKRRWRASLAQPSPAHGKTRLEIAALLEAQGGKCACCAAPASGGQWRVDYDARAQAVRGVLCAHCYAGVQGFRGHTAKVRAAIHYLEAHARRQAMLRELL